MSLEDKPKVFVDYTGFKTGKVTVIGFHSWHYQPSGQRKSKWLCQCECGTQFVALGANLKKENHTTSCGCEKKLAIKKYHDKVKNGQWIPEKLNGKKFGRLTVINFNSWKELSKDQKVSTWNCVCDCGNEVTTRRSNLKESSSCGCWKSEKLSEIQTKHSMHGTPTYKSWQKMKERCYLESYKEKEYYQDRNIEICDRWMNSFENFFEDMGERPENTSLDRIDPNKGYTPNNCRWADATIQSYNRRKNNNNTSGRTGVYQLRNGLWQAIISYYKERIVLAHNVTFEDACKAREEGELKYYGLIKE